MPAKKTAAKTVKAVKPAKKVAAAKPAKKAAAKAAKPKAEATRKEITSADPKSAFNHQSLTW